MKLFDLNNIPKTVSWIKKLSIEEAREQCKLWGIKPKEKLDAMRVQLNEFVARSSEGVVSDMEESADEPRIPVTDDLVDNPSLKQDEIETCTALPPVAPVDLSGLVKTQEIATQNRPNNRDDVSFPKILRDMLREVPITSDFVMCGWVSLVQILPGRMLYRQLGLNFSHLGPLETFSLNSCIDNSDQISDAEIFSTIFTGLNPHTKAALAGLQAPTTVQQLKSMVSMIESLTVNSVQAPLGYGKSESQEAAIDSNKNVTYDNTNLQYAGHLFQNNRYNNRTFYRGSGRDFVRDTAKRHSTFHPNHSFGGNQRQGRWPYNNSRPYQKFHSQPNNSRQGQLRANGYDNALNQRPNPQVCNPNQLQDNMLPGDDSRPRLAFPKKTRPINPLAPALPKVKPLEIPITFSNIKSSTVIDTGSTRSIVAKSVFDALSKLKGVVKKVSEMSINAAQRQVPFPFDTSLVIAENQEDELAEEVSLGPIFGERLDNSQVQAFKNRYLELGFLLSSLLASVGRGHLRVSVVGDL
ncbi:hypothetical protein J6590_090689 [Homalodisca vitripennis]|nr:hypothetical protein J6590_090689 [Homalodisca vitripennis]